MGVRGCATLALLLASCGRIGFTALSGEGGDGGTDGSGSDGSMAVCTPWTLQVTNDPATSLRPALAFGGSDLAVVWEDTRDATSEIYFARVDLTGSKLGQDLRVSNLGDVSFGPSIVAAGANYAIAWSIPSLPASSYTVLDATNTSIGGGGFSSAEEIALAFSGTELAAVTNQGGEIYFTHWPVGASPPLATRLTNHPASSYSPHLTSNGNGYAVAWVDGRDGADNTYFLRLAPDGVELGAETPVSTVDFSVNDPVVVWTGAGYAITWTDYRSGAIGYLRMSVLDAAGSAQLAEAPVIDDGSVGVGAIVTTPTGFGVTWDSDAVYYAIVDGQGAAGAYQLVGPGTSPAMIPLPGGFGVAWEGTDDEIHVARVCL